MRVGRLIVCLLALAGCCARAARPVPTVPPPCLTSLAPTPPAGDASDDAWDDYHARLEAWAAGVERACGAHLLPPAVP